MHNYDRCIQKWDMIFKEEKKIMLNKKGSGNLTFDRGIYWLTKNVDTILDFGCGNGKVLSLCALAGTTSHIGIDLSSEAIKSAENLCGQMNRGLYRFICGGVEVLSQIESETIDAVVLSNILDNLYPEDAHQLLYETKRVLKKKGKVLIKLNPHLTQEQIEQWDIKVIQDNLLDDGLILWNNRTEEWVNIIQEYFSIEQVEDIFYEEYDQYNRMFLVSKPL